MGQHHHERLRQHGGSVFGWEIGENLRADRNSNPIENRRHAVCGWGIHQINHCVQGGFGRRLAWLHFQCGLQVRLFHAGRGVEHLQPGIQWCGHVQLPSFIPFKLQHHEQQPNCWKKSTARDLVENHKILFDLKKSDTSPPALFLKPLLQRGLH